MRPGLYIASFMVTTAAALLAVAGFNMYVDALGISPIRIIVSGFNAYKPLRADQDRLVKKYDVNIGKPATIFIGSSRIKQSFDPKGFEGTPLAPAYNAGIDGNATFGEMENQLATYISYDKNLRRAFIEVFLVSALVIQAHGAKAYPPLLFTIAKDYSEAFLSWDALKKSIEAVEINRRNGGVTNLDGYAPVPRANHHFSVRNIPNSILYLGTIHREFRLAADLSAALRGIVDRCAALGIDCRFVISPIHTDALYGYYYLGLWPELETLKRILASLAPTYDFTRYCDLLGERSGSAVYWPEAFHYTPALGAIVTRLLAGERRPDDPENFGVLLSPDTIEQDLGAWAKERDRWIAAHPEIVARFPVAEANYLRKKSFEEVTAEAVKEGGW